MHLAPRLVRQQHRAVLQRAEDAGADLAAVDQGQHQPVGQDGAELLQQVERQRRAAGPVAVQEAHRRVEAERLQRRAAVVGEEGVEQREQGVDRVERRAARAAAEAQAQGRRSRIRWSSTAK